MYIINKEEFFRHGFETDNGYSVIYVNLKNYMELENIYHFLGQLMCNFLIAFL